MGLDKTKYERGSLFHNSFLNKKEKEEFYNTFLAESKGGFYRLEQSELFKDKLRYVFAHIEDATVQIYKEGDDLWGSIIAKKSKDSRKIKKAISEIEKMTGFTLKNIQ